MLAAARAWIVDLWRSPQRWLTFMASGAVAFAVLIALVNVGQLPLDMYSFRQAQTALTAYWFVVEGFRLDYITPVAGAPWAIPFEFPLYQAIVAALAKMTGLDLNALARLVSFAFLLACIHPIRQLAQRLELPRQVLLVFICLFLTSPMYVYWGRTFMIETTALYFTIAALPYFVDMTRRPFSWKPVLLFGALMTVGLLQKVTTPLPVIAVLGLVWLAGLVRSPDGWRAIFNPRHIGAGVLAFVLPVAIAYGWTVYTDVVKAANAFGAVLTSEAMRTWVFATPADRIAKALYVDVLWKGVLVRNAAGPVGIVILALAFAVSRDIRIKKLIGLALALFVLAPLFFPTLHFHHDYYRVANVIFLLVALALAIGIALPVRFTSSYVAPVLTLVLMGANVICFGLYYLSTTITRYSPIWSREAAVGRALQHEVPQDGVFLAYGYDWNSVLAYMAQRKSFTVAEWFPAFDDVWRTPERYLAGAKPSAVVVCPPFQSYDSLSVSPDDKMYARVVAKLRENSGWYLGEVMGCMMLSHTRDSAEASAALKASPVTCEGELQVADAPGGLLRVIGWTGHRGVGDASPSETYITLTDDTASRAVPAIQTINGPAALKNRLPLESEIGFSGLIDVAQRSTPYTVGLVRRIAGKLEVCHFAVQAPAGAVDGP